MLFLNINQKLTITCLCLSSFLLSYNANAIQKNTKNNEQYTYANKNTNRVKKKYNIIYSIYQGNQLVKTNASPSISPKSYINNKLGEPPYYPSPSLDSDKLSEFIKNNKNSLPVTWGIDTERTTWTNEQSYSSLGNKDIGTELVCLNTTGCSGEISSAIISHPKVWTSPYSTLSWDTPTQAIYIKNLDNNIKSGFYLQSIPENTFFIDKMYITDGNGKFIALTPKTDNYSTIKYNVKFNETIGYFLLKSTPNEKISIWDIDYINDYTKRSEEQMVTSNDGSEETLSAGTYWQLAWTQYAGPNTSYSESETITHGITNTQTSSLGYQLGTKTEFGVDGLFKQDISLSFQQNWSWSTAIQDQTSSTLQISFPPLPTNRVLGIYNLMIGVHTKAPLLEKFLDPNNLYGFNGHIFNNPVKFRLAKSLPSNIEGAENSTDAVSPGGSLINAAVAVSY